ncbi:indole acetimide hydrolase [Halioglobus maricola]|uniref:Indole acetimide hydrolase n=1 Tax=Halioglobus maricola TaxID=2601894 RepID=A0A5P9NGQ5_9GAMM|nr:amidase [Halioglobus maricola]QFU74384.1 indole acetimide hydrolase [Halioglobus maricola]
MANELWRQSACALAQMIKTKHVSSREVVESHLERIETVNPAVNAVTVVLADSALSAADEADGKASTAPLHGVPFSIKENLDCVGSATTQGLPAMAEAVPSADAPVVSRMKAAGAIPLARTNMPELGLRITTDNPLRGRTLNPWDPTRTAGGSSGGEGAALATGMSPIGLGNDIGGSLRNPAYCCGITSLKPTTGRIPHASSLPPEDFYLAAQLMCVDGPMARHVEDLRLAFSILSGRDHRDPFSVDAPMQGPEPACKRAALVTSIPGLALPDGAVSAIRRAGAELAAKGWLVEETAPPELERVNELWGHLLAADIVQTLPFISPLMSEPTVALLDELVTTFDVADMPSLVLHTDRARLMRLWSDFFQSYPLVIGPTWTDLPFLHDADLNLGDDANTTFNQLKFITPGNLLGIPAVALPMGVVDGLPTGVQIYSDLWREDLCLEAAAVIEQAVGQICPIDPLG